MYCLSVSRFRVLFPQHDSSVESSLTIESVTLSDSGIYKCTSDAASEAQVAVLVTSGELPVLLPLELRG